VKRRIRIGLGLSSERLSGLPLVSTLNVVLTMNGMKSCFRHPSCWSLGKPSWLTGTAGIS